MMRIANMNTVRDFRKPAHFESVLDGCTLSTLGEKQIYCVSKYSISKLYDLLIIHLVGCRGSRSDGVLPRPQTRQSILLIDNEELSQNEAISTRSQWSARGRKR
jgi:hypothetical protein